MPRTTTPTTRQHAAETPVNTAPMPIGYRPRHCAGTDCLHSHPNDTRPKLGAWFQLFHSTAVGAS